MKDVLQYNGFIGSVHFNADDAVFYGKIEGISDLVTFEGESVTELQQAFREAIEDYIEICEQKRKPIHKSYKGNLNVKISSELHRKAMQKSLMLGISLNQFVTNAIEHEISNNY
jgi:predicted HicB family RNase H-like nuclease